MNTKNISNLLRQLADEFEQTTTTDNQEYWTINIPKGLTEEQAYQDCAKLFNCWRWYENFDGIISDRDSKKAYSVKVKANIEVDEDLKNLSANDLKEKGIKGITLLERLVLEKDYFLKTGKHLDIKNWTLCAGSRLPGGCVPYASFHGDKFYVLYYDAGGPGPSLRSRSAVLL